MLIGMDRNRIVREAIYVATTAFHFDASEESQRLGKVRITSMDLHQCEPFPAGVTHRFLAVINDVWVYASRTEAGAYTVEPERSHESTQIELNIREQVLRAAEAYLYTGPATDDTEARRTMVRATNEVRTFTIMECPPMGDDAIRAWEVRFPPSSVCIVGMLPSDKGYLFRIMQAN